MIKILILSLAIISCQQQAREVPGTKIVRDTAYSKKKYSKADTNKVVDRSNFYRFVPATDSTSFIKWGNNTIVNLSKTAVYNNYLDKEKIYVKWANEKFMVLGRGTGSDNWIDIILPMTKDQDLRFFENCLAVDKENGLVVYEYPSKDSILIAENIISRRKQILGKNWKQCSSVFYHYCIDSINIRNNEVYIEWVTPNCIDKINKKEIKRIKLDL